MKTWQEALDLLIADEGPMYREIDSWDAEGWYVHLTWQPAAGDETAVPAGTVGSAVASPYWLYRATDQRPGNGTLWSPSEEDVAATDWTVC